MTPANGFTPYGFDQRPLYKFQLVVNRVFADELHGTNPRPAITHFVRIGAFLRAQLNWREWLTNLFCKAIADGRWQHWLCVVYKRLAGNGATDFKARSRWTSATGVSWRSR
jgi:hypothetical protein